MFSKKKSNTPKHTLEQDNVDGNVPTFVSTKLAIRLITILRYQDMLAKNKAKHDPRIIPPHRSYGTKLCDTSNQVLPNNELLLQPSNKDKDEINEQNQINDLIAATDTRPPETYSEHCQTFMIEFLFAKLWFYISLSLRQA